MVPESLIYQSRMHTYQNAAKWIGVNDCVVRVSNDTSSGNNKGTIDFISPLDEFVVVKNVTNALILMLPQPSAYIGKSVIIKNRSTSDNVFVCSGALTTTSASGNIVPYNTNGGFNDSCNIITTAGTTTYRQLMKCYKHTHRLISDGEKWIDCLLST